METLTLTSSQLLAAVTRLDGARLPLRTLAEWADSGLVTPSVSWPRKRGRTNERVYSLADLARLRLVVQLRAAGLSLPRVRVVLAYVDAELRDVLRPRTAATLVVDGYRAYVVRPGTAAVEVPSGQYRLPLRKVVASTEEVQQLVA